MLRFNVAEISAQVFNQNDRDGKQVLYTQHSDNQSPDMKTARNHWLRAVLDR